LLEVHHIHWIDSASSTDAAWYDWDAVQEDANKSADELMGCQTVGFKLWENEHAICLSLSVSAAREQCGANICIPKVAITRHYIMSDEGELCEYTSPGR
jgi:hypothetical protein